MDFHGIGMDIHRDTQRLLFLESIESPHGLTKFSRLWPLMHEIVIPDGRMAVNGQKKEHAIGTDFAYIRCENQCLEQVKVSNPKRCGFQLSSPVVSTPKPRKGTA